MPAGRALVLATAATGERLRLDGRAGARLFRRGAAPAEFAPGTDLSWLLTLPAHFDRPA